MSEKYISLLVDKFSVVHTTLPDAMAMEEYLRKQDRIFDVQCYRTKTNIEEINFFIEARIPQRPVCDIRDKEKIAIVFLPNGHLPLVWPLREKFPLLPHMVSYYDMHPFICLYDAPVADVKRSWTPQEFLQRIFMWLEDSAVGALHRDKQPLENIFPNSPYGNIILPEQVLGSTKLECWTINKDGNDTDTYIMRNQESLAYSLFGVLKRQGDILSDQVRSLRTRDLVKFLKNNPGLGCYVKLGAACEAVNPQLPTELAAYPTDLKKFDKDKLCVFELYSYLLTKQTFLQYPLSLEDRNLTDNVCP